MSYRDEEVAAQARLEHLQAALDDVGRRLAAARPVPSFLERRATLIAVVLASVLTVGMNRVLASGSMREVCPAVTAE